MERPLRISSYGVLVTCQGQFKEDLLLEDVVTGQEFARPLHNLPATWLLDKVLVKVKTVSTFSSSCRTYTMTCNSTAQALALLYILMAGVHRVPAREDHCCRTHGFLCGECTEIVVSVCCLVMSCLCSWHVNGNVFYRLLSHFIFP